MELVISDNDSLIGVNPQRNNVYWLLTDKDSFEEPNPALAIVSYEDSIGFFNCWCNDNDVCNNLSTPTRQM